MVCLTCWLLSVTVILIIIRVLCLVTRGKDKNVCVVVLGDLGRSPRMEYHALSFVKEGFTVNLIGYPGSPPLKELRENSSVKIHYLKPPPELQDRLSRLPSYILKVLWQTVTLAAVLFKQHSSYLIMQNPPAIPTIFVCWLYCFAVRAQFIIDWHNYAHSIMALSLGRNHLLVKAAKCIETFFGRQACKSFCVTKAMKMNLEEEWGIKAEVLYDRPADEFHPIRLEEKHELLLRLSKTYDVFKGDKKNSTAFTECLPDGVIVLRPNRPGLIVSSTSWTEDEDFSVLLDALEDYEIVVDTNELKLPDLICVITGRGPLKDFYISIIKLKKWKHVTIITPWLETEDYPKLLASADLGVSLHSSSSGLDLPMKVVDMFGCGLPVCVYKYQCIHELVKHNENSLVFLGDRELADQLKSWFKNFPNSTEQRKREERFKNELIKFQELRWHGNWSLKVNANLNDRPIIGVLTQEISYHLNQKYPDSYTSYIAASYVKFVEGAGARVVPIWIGQNETYYEDILRKVNGVLFPGGSTYFNQSNGYADAGETIYRIAKRANDNGDYFPLWGICLGFELLTYLAANRVEHRSTCSSNDQPLPLKFKSDFKDSRMFHEVPNDIVDILWNEEVTANYHRYCVTEQDLKKVNLTKEFRVMSLNHDRNGLEFISTLEHKVYPFYGVQFHPEKNIYEWKNTKNIPHGRKATRVSQYFADFFVNEARKNNHNFSTSAEELKSLIYNYPTTYTALQYSAFVQCYMFNETSLNQAQFFGTTS
ncbi:chitobiosyldiphosphodolichol beta-mannosyltransferase [Cephus cinctus]|uniref:folate gamma-glutamyl hydrolase n=1 Tax=Cephus cinctus TaxID=211228 RepID=A0AAJ7BPH7_CEPCN|nr:chitobiosyldiphosphodolichol beta-mannosyltransferase [Cephus cinctus]